MLSFYEWMWWKRKFMAPMTMYFLGNLFWSIWISFWMYWAISENYSILPGWTLKNKKLSIEMMAALPHSRYFFLCYKGIVWPFKILSKIILLFLGLYACLNLEGFRRMPTSASLEWLYSNFRPLIIRYLSVIFSMCV